MHARAFGPEGSDGRGRGRYLAAVDGMIFGDGAGDGFVRGNTFAHKKLGFAFDVPEGFNLENRDEAVLASVPADRHCGSMPWTSGRTWWPTSLPVGSTVSIPRPSAP